MDDRTVVSCYAIAGITTLEGIALATGHDGALLTLAVAAIAGLAGYEIRGRL